jgi:CMP-2-keto-3-deoxyoctulosonic acid synthetase
MDSVEASEGIDLIRFTQRGKRIVAIESFEDTQAVDTPEDLEKVRELTKDVQKSK